MKLLLAAALALVAPAGYVNPTPGREVALQIPGMHRADVRRNLVFAPGQRMDVYRPPSARGAVPAVLFVHGTGGPGTKDTGLFVGWGQLAAASGLAGVVFDNNALQTDVQSAIRYVRRRAADLGIDAKRLCVAGYSAGVLPSMLVALKGSAGTIRCAVAYYGPLDAHYKVSSPLALLKSSSLPILVAKAGRDVPSINTSIDRFVAKGRRVGARVELVVHPTGAHVFDASGDARSRSIIRLTLEFLRAHLRR